jgi:hypothetical protein
MAMRSVSVRMRVWFGVIGATLIAIVSIFTALSVRAAELSGEFALELSPSPVVATVKPGVPTDIKLKIHNLSTAAENYKINARKFTVDSKTGELTIQDTVPADVAQWITFGQPKFTVQSGEWYTQNVHIALPKESGFSYSFAIIISRASDQQIVSGGRLIKGSVADFTLINVDRPGATRKLEITDFSTSQAIYEYLPAQLNISFKNSGNSIVQPAGNVFIQRNGSDTTPIATLPVNDKGGYLLPGSPRTLTTEWNTGFPVFKSTTGADGQQKQDLIWDWSKLTDFRIGPYTAKLVAIYNDGQRDVPIEREVTFWVIPWRSILILIAVISIIAYLRHKQIQRSTRKAVKRALAEHEKSKGPSDAK